MPGVPSGVLKTCLILFHDVSCHVYLLVALPALSKNASGPASASCLKWPYGVGAPDLPPGVWSPSAPAAILQLDNPRYDRSDVPLKAIGYEVGQHFMGGPQEKLLYPNAG